MPELGSMFVIFKYLGILNQTELNTSILNEARELRNCIVHANLYYDDGKDDIQTFYYKDYSYSQIIDISLSLFSFFELLIYLVVQKVMEVYNMVKIYFTEIIENYDFSTEQSIKTFISRFNSLILEHIFSVNDQS